MNATLVQSGSDQSTSRMPVALASLPAGGSRPPELLRVNFPATAASSATPSNQKLVEALAASTSFREYQRAFRDATGLPLALRPVVGWQLAHQGDHRQNAFCGLMGQSNRSCAGCLQMQQQMCEAATGEPATQKCAFGIYETTVAVQLGHETIAYLQTGQVFFKAPTLPQTRHALQQLADWGLHLDEAEVARCYQATPVVPQAEYEGQVRLLQFFADQLASQANQIVLQQQSAEPEQITRARNFIEANYQEAMSLTTVARQAGMSSFHFCKVFKKATGLNYTKYVNRVRVEKAKHLLLNLNYRISEVAFDVGFQSLTHFNRAFKVITCQSPTEYREKLANN